MTTWLVIGGVLYAFLIIFFVRLIFAILKRAKEKENEDFEDREN